MRKLAESLGPGRSRVSCPWGELFHSLSLLPSVGLTQQGEDPGVGVGAAAGVGGSCRQKTPSPGEAESWSWRRAEAEAHICCGPPRPHIHAYRPPNQPSFSPSWGSPGGPFRAALGSVCMYSQFHGAVRASKRQFLRLTLKPVLRLAANLFMC